MTQTGVRMGGITGGRAVAHLLRDYGVRYVFGLPGGQTYPLYVGIHKLAPAIQHILMRCEKCAAFAADAYARVSGRPGVCDATVGPGATNMLSGVAEAWSSSIAMIAVTSDVHTWMVGKSAAQEADILAMLRPFSKAGFYVGRADRIPSAVRQAFRIAATGRPGPVHLDFPADVLTDSVDFGADLYAEPEYGVFPANRVAPDPSDVERAAEAILAAKRPVIFAGGGVITSGATEALRALGELLTVPVGTSVMGKGAIVETHPLSLGTAMTIYEPERVLYLRGARILAEADLVIFLGHRTDQFSTADWQVPRPGTRTVHLDVDPAEIGRNYPVAAAVVGDLRLSLEALLALFRGRSIGARPDRRREIAEAMARWRTAVAHALASDQVPIASPRVMAELSSVMPSDALLVTDASLATVWTAHYVNIQTPGRSYIAGRGQAGMGYGVPAVIGAKLAAPERPVICVGGDGAFAMALHELETLRRLDLDITYIVLNNSCLGYSHKAATGAGLPSVSCQFSPLDYAAIARDFGCLGLPVEAPGHLRDALASAIQHKGPAIVDVLTDVDFPVRAGGMVVS